MDSCGAGEGEGDPCPMPCRGAGGSPGWRMLSIHLSDQFSIAHDVAALLALSF